MREEDSGAGAGGEGKSPHVIRLRGPWRDESGGRVSLPGVWGARLGGIQRVTLSRSFNWVRESTDAESVTLRVESPQSVERILVNGLEILDGGELGSVLDRSNLLTVSLSLLNPDAPILDAWLEIIELD